MSDELSLRDGKGVREERKGEKTVALLMVTTKKPPRQARGVPLPEERVGAERLKGSNSRRFFRLQSFPLLDPLVKGTHGNGLFSKSGNAAGSFPFGN